MAIAARHDDKQSQTVVIVGGGPIGLAHAWGLKKLNPSLRVVVLEKYEEYQRSHTLIMQHQPLEELMRATESLNDPGLSQLLTRLKKNPHIRTNDLENEFKKLAKENGVEIRIEEVKESSIHAQLEELKPSLIIGADGTHSIVNQSLFPKGNQVKVPFDYVLQLRFEVDGKANAVRSFLFYQMMARYGMIANEYVGRYDEEKKKTPVTMQMMISKDVFLELQKATSKSPITPFSLDQKDMKEEKRDSGVAEDKTISYTDIPPNIRGFIDNYLHRKWVSSHEVKHNIDPKSVRISVNEAPATYAKQPVYAYKGIPVVLVGDAGLGLSYFKGLNAGIEAAAKWFSTLAATIRSGFTKINDVEKNHDEYTGWFTGYFAPLKVKEVESYSTYQIRFPEKAMQKIRYVKESSMMEDLAADDAILEQYFKVFGKQSSHVPQYGFKNLYPHRSYDPNIRLGQFDYIPISYTLLRILKLFYSYFKPYKSAFQVKEDFKQPLVGIVNVLSGILKILAGLCTINGRGFFDGLFSFVRGVLEIVTFPFAYTIKPLMRGLITLIVGKPKVEENSGVKKLSKLGLKLLEEIKDDKELEDDHLRMYRLLAISSDLHRKFDKSLGRNQSSNIKLLDEEAIFTNIRSSAVAVGKSKFKEYFLLFSKDQKQSVPDSQSVRIAEQPKVS